MKMMVVRLATLHDAAFGARPLLAGDRWRSEVVAGFELDAAPVRAASERF